MKNIEHKGFRKNEIILDGIRYLLGNGYFGYRGTLSEYTKAEMVALNLNGIYDQMGELWRESINAFNPLYTIVRVRDTELNPTKIKPVSHVQGIRIEDGVFYRETVFSIKDHQIKISSERFADQKQRQLLYERYVIKSDSNLKVDLYTGIDLDVYNLSGKHLEILDQVDEADFFFVKARTKQLGLPVVVGETTTRNFDAKGEVLNQNNKLLRHYSIQMEAESEYIIEKFTGVCHTRFDSYEHLDMLVTKAQKLGYLRKFTENKAFWREKWDISGIEVIGDDDAELGINYSIYQLISSRPYSDRVSIPARGLSGQVYKGAVFWDTEMFMLPFFLNTDLESARHIVMYRIIGLKGAKSKAEAYGFKGAFYAWESQEDGYEACSDYNITDALTGEPVRTYFREKQIHINGAIVNALGRYVERSGDIDILFLGGLEMAIECSKFYLDYLTYNRDTKLYEALQVIGPDEYHELVDNNAYTNYLIDFVFDKTIELIELAREENPGKIAQFIKDKDYQAEIQKIRQMRQKVYLPGPDDTNVIEQFSGYFELEDITLADLKKRIKHPNEYLGGKDGVATPTKIIKQADVVTLLALLPEKFTKVVKKANFNYYEPKTEHGSSLSASMHALLACDIGKPNYAYEHFMSSALIDLNGKAKQFAGGIYIGGTHLAACGGAYLALIYGFCGLKHHNYVLSADTRLTSKIKEVRFKILNKNRLAAIKVTGTTANITWENGK
ncbi:MAG: glycoside hydrolase family 65 protein [Bacilli bacterium]|nr:glycoside hydrolase family 65 protein [Bacilli bacterium]MBN2695972.1 glycoside hydrolase family 65 protein [Bacilli bacterium]